MKRWQMGVLAGLVLIPVAVYAAWSGYALWRLGGLGYWAWIVPCCWTLAWWLARRWQPDTAGRVDRPATHWTARDEAAWALVTQRARDAGQIPAEQLLDPHFYLSAAQRLALDIARHYHPHAADPLGPLTVPEVMAAAELALRDTSQWVRDYVPGSHLLRIDHWRMVAEAPRWARLAGNAWWLGTILLNPADIVRQLVAKFSVDSASKELQAGLLAGFYSVFVQRAGYYLIEVHSGRLRLGADHYRDVQRRFGPASAHAPAAEFDRTAATSTASADSARPPLRKETAPVEASRDETSRDEVETRSPPEADASLKLVVAGQAKAGKSSLINALLGASAAEVDLLPCTREMRRYRWSYRDVAAELTLLDSPGYGDSGLEDHQYGELLTALDQADALLLVMDATSPARQPDIELLAEVRRRLALHPERKAPPVIGVLTHIDGLRPLLEWAPPYDWQQPTRPKEQTIHDAVEYNAGLFQPPLRTLAPVCLDRARDRVYGLEEWLLPALIAQLDEARACALLRHLHHDWDRQKIRHLWQQLVNVGRKLWQPVGTGR